ncbi:MAG TPA: uroporphyrinogen-III synthase [Terriglobia bacterium]
MSARPLAGKRIAITRARAQSSALRQPLEDLGAEVVEIPTIEIRDPESWAPLDQALGRLAEFHFLILTSVNGVRRLLERLPACERTPLDLARLEVGAIGPATAAELAQAGVRVDFVPKAYRAEGLIESLSGRDLRGKSFLIPRAKVARDLVPRVLTERGAWVEVVEAYQTVLPALTAGALDHLLTPPPDLVTFTSSSTAANFARLLEEQGTMSPSAVKAASIGPVTSETARQLGFEVVLEASESTIPGLAAAIRDYFIGVA